MVIVTMTDGERTAWDEATSFDVTEAGRLALFHHEKPFAMIHESAWLVAEMDPADV